MSRARTEHELSEYRWLSPHAMVGLVLGLLSAVALLDPLAWLLPAAGIVVSLIAIVRIARNPQTFTGQKLAWTGLALSLLFAAAGPTDWYLYRYLVRREALAFARPWFQLIGEREIHKAYLLSVEPHSRLPLDISLPEMCRRAAYLCTELEGYRKDPAVKALEALGENRVRFCRFEGQLTASDRDSVRAVFEASPAHGNPAATLRVALSLERLRLRGAQGWRLGRAEWRLLRAEIVPM